MLFLLHTDAPGCLWSIDSVLKGFTEKREKQWLVMWNFRGRDEIGDVFKGLLHNRGKMAHMGKHGIHMLIKFWTRCGIFLLYPVSSAGRTNGQHTSFLSPYQIRSDCRALYYEVPLNPQHQVASTGKDCRDCESSLRSLSDRRGEIDERKKSNNCIRNKRLRMSGAGTTYSHEYVYFINTQMIPRDTVIAHKICFMKPILQVLLTAVRVDSYFIWLRIWMTKLDGCSFKTSTSETLNCFLMALSVEV